MKRSYRLSAIALVAAVSVAYNPLASPAQVQSKPQQGCINALNKSGAKVAKAQAKDDATCLKNAGKAKETDAQSCLTDDDKGKVAKAMLKTASTATKKCTEDPSFGRAPLGQLNAAASDQEVALVADIFGADLTAVAIAADSDKTGAGCQGAILKAADKLAATKIKTFLKCKKLGLKDGSIDSAAALEGCFDTVAADTKVAKAITKLVTTVTKKCTDVTLASAFPGDCSLAGDFGACVDEAVECRVCLMLDAMDSVVRDCDLYDNAAADLSCAMLPTTTTTSTTTTTLPTGPDWGLDCFTTMDCGSAFCPSTGCQCDAFLLNVGLSPAEAMCFFDCMDGDLMDVTDCRDDCGGSGAPACASGTAGSGGYDGVVTGPGACEPSGFAASVDLGGSAGELKRVLVDFTVPIDESKLFSSVPPACSGTCPTPGTDCDVGAPYSSAPLPDMLRLAIGDAFPADDICTREGVATSACKFSSTGYALILDAPVCTTTAVDVSMFMSCHIEDSGGGTFLHFATGDFFFVGTWPP